MIEVLVLDLCALLLAPELRAKLLLSQAEKDGLKLMCYAHLPRENMRRALRVSGYLQSFDSLLYDEIMLELSSNELRLLADRSQVLWLLTPEEVDYRRILPLLSPRRRLLPKALRASLDANPIFPQGSEHTD